MIIDSHVHAGKSDALDAPWTTFQDIRLCLKQMDQAGIDKAVVLPIGSTGFEKRNRETAETVKKYPDRLYGYAKVSQVEDKGRVGRLLAEAFNNLGLVGLKLHGLLNREIMDVMSEYRKPVLVDVAGDVYPLRFVAENYPTVPLIIAHMGKWLCADGKIHETTLWLAKEYPNVYFDTAGVILHEWLERAVQEGLCRKMIFGSDAPGCHCGVELARVKYLNLSRKDEELVLWKNIAGLIGFEPHRRSSGKNQRARRPKH